MYYEIVLYSYWKSIYFPPHSKMLEKNLWAYNYQLYEVDKKNNEIL